MALGLGITAVIAAFVLVVCFTSIRISSWEYEDEEPLDVPISKKKISEKKL